jgi:hypothetical protein
MKPENLEGKGFVRIDGMWGSRSVLLALERIARNSEPTSPEHQT